MNRTASVSPYVPSNPVRQMLEGTFRQKRLFTSVALPVLLASVLITFLTHRQYASEMKFIVQNNRGNVVVTPERTNPTNIISEVTEAQVNSELEVLHSHDVIDPVADQHWERIPENQRNARAVRNHEKRLRDFETRFSTEIVRKTNVISVTLLGNTPQEARDDLELLCTAYLAKHRRLQRPYGASEFFTGETERIRKSWDYASRQLVDFQKAHQLISLPDRESSLEKQIIDAEHDLSDIDTSLRELDAGLSASSKQLEDLPKRHTTAEREIPNQQSIQSLNTLLVELQNKRTSQLTNYKPSDRTVRELDQQIATTIASLAEATATTANERTTDIDPSWQQVHTNFVKSGITRHELAAQKTSLISQLAQNRMKLASLKDLTVQFNNLQAHEAELRDNYDLYVQKRDQAQIEDAMDEQKLLNVAIAQQPTLSFTAERPKRLTNMLLGALSSLLLGVCVVYLAETGRRTIATPGEIDQFSRYPVLATVPQISLSNGVVGGKPPFSGRHIISPMARNTPALPLSEPKEGAIV